MHFQALGTSSHAIESFCRILLWTYSALLLQQGQAVRPADDLPARAGTTPRRRSRKPGLPKAPTLQLLLPGPPRSTLHGNDGSHSIGSCYLIQCSYHDVLWVDSLHSCIVTSLATVILCLCSASTSFHRLPSTVTADTASWADRRRRRYLMLRLCSTSTFTSFYRLPSPVTVDTASWAERRRRIASWMLCCTSPMVSRIHSASSIFLLTCASGSDRSRPFVFYPILRSHSTLSRAKHSL